MADKKRYKVAAPVVVDGKRHAAGESVTADPDAVAFLVQVGALVATAKSEPKAKDSNAGYSQK